MADATANEPIAAEEPKEIEEGEEKAEGSEAEGEGEEGAKAEYEKCVFEAKAYASESIAQVEAEVHTLIPKNTRPLIKMRVTRPRKHFGDVFAAFLDKEA